MTTPSSSPPLTRDEFREIANHIGFTGRQTDIVWGLITGSTDKQTSSRLGIAESTVRAHYQNIYDRLGVRDRPELLLLVFRVFRQLYVPEEGPASGDGEAERLSRAAIHICKGSRQEPEHGSPPEQS